MEKSLSDFINNLFAFWTFKFFIIKKNFLFKNENELFCQYFSEKLRMNMLIIEYPGYLIYNIEKTAQIMCEDSLIVYDWIKEAYETKVEDI